MYPGDVYYYRNVIVVVVVVVIRAHNEPQRIAQNWYAAAAQLSLLQQKRVTYTHNGRARAMGVRVNDRF